MNGAYKSATSLQDLGNTIPSGIIF